MYTKNVHHGNVIHTVYTICLQKVYYQCSNFGKGIYTEIGTHLSINALTGIAL